MRREKPVIATPNAVPAARGCSVSITTIIKMERPTASAYIMADDSNAACGINANNDPAMSHTTWPPITFFG